ncbi:MAG: caspase family protein, partial [Mangrovimonas sp.]|nr:caspase family protein [Mangrovimonas sp.]
MNKIALVVGVNDYQHFDKLDKCVNDAVAMSEFLEVAGFEV